MRRRIKSYYKKRIRPNLYLSMIRRKNVIAILYTNEIRSKN